MKSSLLFIECILSFLLVFSQSAGSGLYIDFSKGMTKIGNPPGYSSSYSYTFVVPENGYIFGHTISSSYKPRWINCSINGASITSTLGINADDSTSIPFIAVKKGDKVSFDYFCSKIILYYMYGRT